MKRALHDLAARATGLGIRLACRIVTAVRADWAGCEPVPRQRIYFANHCSNADLPVIWTVLPPAMRRRTRPVAAADYWLTSPLRAFVGRDVLDAVLIQRKAENRAEGEDPLAQIYAALDDGASLILFPEGQRNMTDADLLPFKAGIYNIGKARPEVELIPVWIENLNAIMPKGEVVPLPLICTVTFGAAVQVGTAEDKEAFLTRAADALRATAPNATGASI